MENLITELNLKTVPMQITEEAMLKLFNEFTRFIREQNYPEYRKFIEAYVEKVLIFKDHVEVTFTVASFSLHRDAMTIVSKLRYLLPYSFFNKLLLFS